MNYQVYYKYNIKDNISPGLQKIAGQSTKTKRALSKLFIESGRDADNFKGKVGKLDGKIKKLGSTSKKSSTSFRSFGFQILAIAGAVKVFNTVRSFDKDIASFHKTLGKGTAPLKKYRDEMLRIGGTTRFTAGQVADAATLVAKSGVTDFDQLFGIVSAATKLASLEQLDDLTKISEVILQVQKAYENFGKSYSSNDIFETLATTLSNSSLDFARFSGSLKNIISLAAQMQIPFKELTTTLGILSDQAVFKGSGGTKIRMWLRSIVDLGNADISSKQGKAFLSMYDIQDYNKISLARQLQHTGEASILTSLKAQYQGYQAVKDKASAQGNLQAIYGKRGSELSIAMGNLKKFITLLETSNTTMDIDKKISIATNQLDEDFQILLSTIDALILEMGDRGLKGAFRSLTQSITAVLRGAISGDMTGLSPTQQKYARNISDFATQLPKILNHIFGGGSTKGIGSIGMTIISVVKTLSSLPGLFITLVEQVTIVASALAKIANSTIFSGLDVNKTKPVLDAQSNRRAAHLNFQNLQNSPYGKDLQAWQLRNPMVRGTGYQRNSFTRPVNNNDPMPQAYPTAYPIGPTTSDKKSELDIKLYMMNDTGSSTSVDFEKRESGLKLGFNSLLGN